MRSDTLPVMRFLFPLLVACDTPDAPPTPPRAEPTPAPAPPPPPDPCRHAVLEQLSPAALAGFSGDEACMARVQLWREQERLWAASADLDGDAVSENIVLLAGDCAEGCTATLIIGSGALTVTLDALESVRLIDTDPSDALQEVLLIQRAPAESSRSGQLFTYVDGLLTERRRDDLAEAP